MASHKEYMKMNIPTAGELKRKKRKYYVFIDLYDRLYFVKKSAISPTKPSKFEVIEDVYIVLPKAYNTDPEQYTDDGDLRFDMPSEDDLVLLRYDSKKTENVDTVLVKVRDTYRYKWNKVGVTKLQFEYGLPPIKR